MAGASSIPQTLEEIDDIEAVTAERAGAGKAFATEVARGRGGAAFEAHHVANGPLRRVQRRCAFLNQRLQGRKVEEDRACRLAGARHLWPQELRGRRALVTVRTDRF